VDGWVVAAGVPERDGATVFTGAFVVTGVALGGAVEAKVAVTLTAVAGIVNEQTVPWPAHTEPVHFENAKPFAGFAWSFTCAPGRNVPVQVPGQLIELASAATVPVPAGATATVTDTGMAYVITR